MGPSGVDFSELNLRAKLAERFCKGRVAGVPNRSPKFRDSELGIVIWLNFGREIFRGLTPKPLTRSDQTSWTFEVQAVQAVQGAQAPTMAEQRHSALPAGLASL